MSENDSGTVELTRRKALGSMAILGAAGAGAGAGSWAYWSAEDTSENNTISAGAMDLSVEDGSGNNFAYSFSNIAPGESDTVTAAVNNDGDVDAAELAIDTSLDLGGDTPNLADQLEITSATYGGTDVASAFPSTIGDMASTTVEITESLASGASKDLDVEVQFSPNAGNDYQDVSVDVTNTFTLRQEPGQDG